MRSRRRILRLAVFAGVTRSIWAISVAVGAAVARVVAERGAATAWEAATGAPPPGLDE